MSEKLSYWIEEAYEVLGMTRSAMYEAIKSGDLQSYKEGRRRMISRRALVEFVAKREREAQPGKARAA
jgi:excisionase family DNA binding protein